MVSHAPRRVLWIVLSAVVLWLTAPVPSVASASSSLEALELAVITRTNAVRAEHGLGPVSFDPLLRQAARGHSAEMLHLDYFAHSSPTAGRETVSERVALAGATEVEVGENLAFYEGYDLDEIANRVVADWMNSPGHRANLMKGAYNSIGVGVSYNGRKCLVTQVFASERFALEPVSPVLRNGQVAVRLRGKLRTPAREAAVFDGRQALQRVPIGPDGRFDVTVTLRANSGLHNVSMGLLQGNDGQQSTFALYTTVPVNTSAVAAAR